MRSSALLGILCLILLAGCPPKFPGCPSPPALDLVGTEADLIGSWTGSAISSPHEGSRQLYEIGMVLYADKSFWFTAREGNDVYSMEGTWAVNPLAESTPRIELGVACSNFDPFPPSSWHRGAYFLSKIELTQGDHVSQHFMFQFQVSTYPDPPLNTGNSTSIVWSLERDEP